MAEQDREEFRRPPILALVLVLWVAALLVVAGCTGSGTSFPNTTTMPGARYPAGGSTIVLPSPSAGGPVVTVDLVAENMAFRPTVITVPAGASIIVNFHNREQPGSSQVTGIAHNFAVYDSPAANTTIFSGEIITGGSDAEYRFTAPGIPGNYFFRCDVHPETMNGQFIVT